MLADNSYPYHKAHAVNGWNRMASGHQALVKKHCTDLATDKRFAEAEHRRVAREEKKLARETTKGGAYKQKEEQKKANAAVKRKTRNEREAAKAVEKRKKAAAEKTLVRHS